MYGKFLPQFPPPPQPTTTEPTTSPQPTTTESPPPPQPQPTTIESSTTEPTTSATAPKNEEEKIEYEEADVEVKRYAIVEAKIGMVDFNHPGLTFEELHEVAEWSSHHQAIIQMCMFDDKTVFTSHDGWVALHNEIKQRAYKAKRKLLKQQRKLELLQHKI